MYLTRLTFNWRTPDARKLAANRYALHQLLEASHNAPKDVNGVRLLWRLEREPITNVLVQSAVRLDHAVLGDAFATFEDKPFNPTLVNGAQVLYRIALNTVKRSEGKVIGYVPTDELDGWAVNKMAQHGFNVGIEHIQQDTFAFQKPHHKRVKLAGAVLEGVATVVDASKATNALKSGIGRGKFAGLGMLSIA